MWPRFFLAAGETKRRSPQRLEISDRSAVVTFQLPLLCGFHPASEPTPCNVAPLLLGCRRDEAPFPADTGFVRSMLVVPVCHFLPECAQDPVAPGSNSSCPTPLWPDKEKPPRRGTLGPVHRLPAPVTSVQQFLFSAHLPSPQP